ncbi:MAG: hypothetical protein ACP5VQ_06880 [Phycisphaerae bacterium]
MVGLTRHIYSRAATLVMVLAGGALIGAAGIQHCQEQTSSVAGSEATVTTASALLAQGLRDLSSERYAVRQQATKTIEIALGMQLQAIIDTGGPEQATRLIKLLDYNINLDRWTMAVIKLPPQQRAAMFKWGLQPALLPLVGAAFARRADVRASAAAGLAKLPGANSNWLLDRLLLDPRRVVYLSTMAALWSRQPSPRMIDIVFHRAVGNTIMYGGATTRQVVHFNGQNITIMHFVNYWQQAQDGQYAAQLLAHWRPAELKSLLLNYTEKLARDTAVNNIIQNPSMLQGRNFIRLFTLYKPHRAAPYLLNLINRPQTNEINFMFNGQSVHWDNRTIPLYLLVLLSGHKPQRYHFFKSALYGGSWLFNTQLQEENTIKAMLNFWKQRGVVPIPPVANPTSKPKSGPEPKPGLVLSPVAIPAGAPISLPAQKVVVPAKRK